MNYLVQIKGFWIAQNAYSLGIEEVGLYFYLLEISNTLRWMNPFKRNNSKVMSDLGIRDRRTLDRYRNRLKQAGIIVFETKNGDANVTYRLNDLSIFCTGFGIGDGIGDGIGSCIGNGIDNINKTKPSSLPDSNESGTPKKSSSGSKASKKKKVEENPTEYWQAMVSIWFDFNEKKLQITPSFKGSDPRDLKTILETLKKRAKAKTIEWTEHNAKTSFNAFLLHSYKDDWLNKHFLLSNLLKQFDTIITPNNGNGTSNNNATSQTGKPAATIRKQGASVDELQNLKRGAGSGNPERVEFTSAEVVE